MEPGEPQPRRIHAASRVFPIPTRGQTDKQVRICEMQNQTDGHGETLTSWGCPGPTRHVGSDESSPSQRLGFLPASKRWSEVMVAQSCQTLQPHGLQPARLLCPWDLQARTLGWVPNALLQGISPTQGSKLAILHCRKILYCLSQVGFAFSTASARAPGDGRRQDPRATPT